MTKSYYLQEITYIDDFSDHNLVKMLRQEFKSKVELPDEIILYQNTNDGRKYKLRTLDKNILVNLYEGKIL